MNINAWTTHLSVSSKLFRTKEQTQECNVTIVCHCLFLFLYEQLDVRLCQTASISPLTGTLPMRWNGWPGVTACPNTVWAASHFTSSLFSLYQPRFFKTCKVAILFFQTWNTNHVSPKKWNRETAYVGWPKHFLWVCRQRKNKHVSLSL